ncbi:MAG TPA: hypothetical protein VM261_32705 [Kofleriaceae bacterium]|nr:hypothetical protein [Kofleriaceae bacterium]
MNTARFGAVRVAVLRVAAAVVVVVCAGARFAAAQPAPEPKNAAWVAIPSIDGHAGLEVGVERGVAPRVGLVVSANVRQTAAGDYDAVRVGVAAEYRKYWRGRAKWNAVAGLDRTGWFYGARVDLGTSRLSMSGMDERHIGSTVVAGARAELGYRLTPWRGLVVTAIGGIGGAVERDAAGRLPTERKTVLGFGLDVGWMF